MSNHANYAKIGFTVVLGIVATVAVLVYLGGAVGDDDIRMDENELRYAQWVRRDDIVPQPNNLSVTNEMMMMFKEGKA